MPEPPATRALPRPLAPRRGAGPDLHRVVGALWPSAGLAGRVLDERNDAAGHKPSGANGFARARHLNDLDNAPTRRDLDSASGPAGDDLVRPRTIVSGHDNFHAIALHKPSVLRPSRRGTHRPETRVGVRSNTTAVSLASLWKPARRSIVLAAPTTRTRARAEASDWRKQRRANGREFRGPVPSPERGDGTTEACSQRDRRSPRLCRSSSARG